MTPPLIGMLPFGLVCGVGAQAAGASVWENLGLSALMFSGAAQILATQLVAAGAPVAITSPSKGNGPVDVESSRRSRLRLETLTPSFRSRLRDS